MPPKISILFILKKIYKLARKGLKFCFVKVHKVTSRINPYTVMFFRKILADFPELFPECKKSMRQSLTYARLIDVAVASALLHLEPIASSGFIHLSRLKRIRRSLTTIDDYYEMCHNALTIDRHINTNMGMSNANRQISHFAYLKNGKKRNILFITSEFPSPFHGGGKRVLNCIEILGKKNRIFLVTKYNESRDKQVENSIFAYCESVLKIPYKEWGDNHEQINKWLNRTKINVVHYEWPDSLKNFHKDLGDYHVFTYMESVSLRLLIDLQKSRYSSAQANLIFSQMIAAMKMELVDTSPMSALVAVTEKDAKFLQNLLPYNEYTVINTGFDFDSVELPERDPEPRTMAFIGNYRHYPNVDAMRFFLSEVFPLIKRDVPEARIYIVGPHAPEALRKRFTEPSIIFTGEVPDIRTFIQRVEVCVAPLVNGAGMRGKVLDYAALKRPFVATDIAMAGLAFVDREDYLMANTAEEFAQSSVRLMKEPALRKVLTEHAYKTAKTNYCFDRISEMYDQLYSNLEDSSHVQ